MTLLAALGMEDKVPVARGLDQAGDALKDAMKAKDATSTSTLRLILAALKDRDIAVHERHIMPEEMERFEQCWLTGTAGLCGSSGS